MVAACPSHASGLSLFVCHICFIHGKQPSQNQTKDGNTVMSNSSRIEAATRQMVGAILTSKQVQDAVKLAFPEDGKGVYPSDCAWKRDAEGVLQPRGKVAYGDSILEFLAENSFKVLSDQEIVRMPRKRVAKPAPAATVEPPTAPVVAAPEPALKSKAKSKKKSKKQAA